LGLAKVPERDQYSVRLPVDPWTRLSERFGLEDISPYDEIWAASKDVALYVKNAIKLPPGKPKSYRVLYEDSGKYMLTDCYTAPRSADPASPEPTDNGPVSPMSPALLTKRAIEATPELGIGTKVPFSNGAALLSQAALNPVRLPEVPVPQVDRDDILCVNAHSCANRN
jgi:hypothetical protein